MFHTVELRKTSAGKILVNTSGSILFEFTKDSSKHDSCVKIHGCDQIWIPEPVSGKPSAGPGLEGSQLSTIKLSAGNDQVTYAGHPLYVYAADPTAAVEKALRDRFGLEEFRPGQREVIEMLKVAGMSLEEVARATSSTVGSVKQKVHRGYKKLRETMSAAGFSKGQSGGLS